MATLTGSAILGGGESVVVTAQLTGGDTAYDNYYVMKCTCNGSQVGTYWESITVASGGRASFDFICWPLPFETSCRLVFTLGYIATEVPTRQIVWSSLTFTVNITTNGTQAYIYNSGWLPAVPYIYNGGWGIAVPHIYNGGWL